MCYINFYVLYINGFIDLSNETYSYIYNYTSNFVKFEHRKNQGTEVLARVDFIEYYFFYFKINDV